MPLQRVSEYWGGTQVTDADPVVSVLHDAVLLPQQGGVYLDTRELGRSVGTYHGPERHLLLPGPATDVDVASINLYAPDAEYVYGGLIHAHYGHALMSTLSRFWGLARSGKPRSKILMHAYPDWYRVPYLRFWMENLGLGEDDFAVFHEPVRLTKVIVPSLAVEEMWWASRAFADLCRLIAERADAVRQRRSDLAPIYLSKAHLTSGVQRLYDEEALEEAMVRRGVEVVYPEELTLADQIRLMHERPYVLGTAGSAMHTSLFVQGGCRIVGLLRSPLIHGNYGLIDALVGNSSVYLCQGLERPGPPDEAFSATFVIDGHDQVAEEMIRAAEEMAPLAGIVEV